MSRPIRFFLAEFGTGAAATPSAASKNEGGVSPILSPVGAALMLAPPAPLGEAAEPIAEDVSHDAAPPIPEPPAPALADIVATLRADHATALAEARRNWAESEGAALARQLDTALASLETRILDVLAPVLEPFLVKAARLKALDELRDALRVLLRSGSGQTVAVTGPADLLGALEAAHPGEPALVFAVADTPDVTIVAGETLVRSRLRDWASDIEASLGDRA